jgi:hypothetical protein
LVTNGKWLAGYAALWIILEGMIEAGAPEIASGLAALIALGFTLSQGNEILDNLNKLVQGKAS